MSSSPFVYALTLNWNGEVYFKDFCRGIMALDYPNYRIVLIDNASSDGSVRFVREHFPSIEIIENATNVGYAAGFNVGIKQGLEAGADYFFILNNDTVVPNDTLKNLVEVAVTDPNIGFVSGKVYFNENRKQFQTVGKVDRLWNPTIINVGQNQIDEGQFEEQRDYDFLDDVFWLVNRDVFEKVHGYDPNFFMYWSEADLCARARRQGFRLVFTPSAKIYHMGSLSTGGGDSPQKGYHLRRNAVLFYWRHKPFLVFVVKMIVVLASIGEWKRLSSYIIRGKHKDNLKSEWAGFLDGIKYLLSGRFRYWENHPSVKPAGSTPSATD